MLCPDRSSDAECSKTTHVAGLPEPMAEEYHLPDGKMLPFKEHSCTIS